VVEIVGANRPAGTCNRFSRLRPSAVWTYRLYSSRAHLVISRVPVFRILHMQSNAFGLKCHP
jgi:hypothetical protein